MQYAAERTALDVVEGQTTLAVLDYITGTLGQSVDLVSTKKRNEGMHVVLSRSPRVDAPGRVRENVQY
jgi:hypothetical protein